MGELEDLHTDRTNICFTTIEAEGEGWDPHPPPTSPPPTHTNTPHYWIFQGGTLIVVLVVNCYVVFHFLMFLF